MSWSCQQHSNHTPVSFRKVLRLNGGSNVLVGGYWVVRWAVLVIRAASGRVNTFEYTLCSTAYYIQFGCKLHRHHYYCAVGS